MKRLVHFVLALLAAAAATANPSQQYCADLTGVWTAYDSKVAKTSTFTLNQDNTQNPPVLSGTAFYWCGTGAAEHTAGKATYVGTYDTRSRCELDRKILAQTVRAECFAHAEPARE